MKKYYGLTEKELENILKLLWSKIYIKVFMLLNAIPVKIALSSMDTACCSIKPTGYYIYIGRHIFRKMKNRYTKDIEKKKYYVASYIWHEIGHLLYTPPAKEIVTKLIPENIGFDLFNLFEDGRVEYLIRKKFKRPFKWVEIEDNEFDNSPTSCLFAIIQAEGKVDTELESIFGKELIEKVSGYYKRIIECEKAIDLIPLLKEWIEEFEDNDISSRLKDMFFPGDLGFQLMNPEKQTEFLGEVYFIEKNEDEDIEQETNSVMLEEYSTESLLLEPDDSDCHNMEKVKEEAEKYIKQVESILKAKKYVHKYSSYTPAKRFSRNLMIGNSDKVYRKREQKKADGGNKGGLFNLIIDCSGSMWQTHSFYAVVFLYILNEIAKKGLVKGHVILTKGECSTGYVNTFKLPVSVDIIRRIPADGDSENLKNGIVKTRKILKQARWNFVFTDGQITDLPIYPKDRVGINLMGLYVGKPENARLDSWFNKGIARGTFKELVSELARKI